MVFASREMGNCNNKADHRQHKSNQISNDSYQTKYSDKICLTTNGLHAFCSIKGWFCRKKLTYPTHLMFKLTNHTSFKTVQKSLLLKSHWNQSMEQIIWKQSSIVILYCLVPLGTRNKAHKHYPPKKVDFVHIRTNGNGQCNKSTQILLGILQTPNSQQIQ